MMEWQVLSDGALVGHPFKLSFPLCGNGLSKPLDSGLRRNDDGGVEPNCSTDQSLLCCDPPSDPLSKARQAGRNAALSLLFPFPLFNIIIVHQYPVGLSFGVVELAGVDRPVERGREEGDEAERDQDQ